MSGWFCFFFFFKQKTAYEMRISDWSSDVCSSDLQTARRFREAGVAAIAICFLYSFVRPEHEARAKAIMQEEHPDAFICASHEIAPEFREFERLSTAVVNAYLGPVMRSYIRSEEHTSELQSLMRNSYAVFCLQ